MLEAKVHAEVERCLLLLGDNTTPKAVRRAVERNLGMAEGALDPQSAEMKLAIKACLLKRAKEQEQQQQQQQQQHQLKERENASAAMAAAAATNKKVPPATTKTTTTTKKKKVPPATTKTTSTTTKATAATTSTNKTPSSQRSAALPATAATSSTASSQRSAASPGAPAVVRGQAAAAASPKRVVEAPVQQAAVVSSPKRVASPKRVVEEAPVQQSKEDNTAAKKPTTTKKRPEQAPWSPEVRYPVVLGESWTASSSQEAGSQAGPQEFVNFNYESFLPAQVDRDRGATAVFSSTGEVVVERPRIETEEEEEDDVERFRGQVGEASNHNDCVLVFQGGKFTLQRLAKSVHKLMHVRQTTTRGMKRKKPEALPKKAPDNGKKRAQGVSDVRRFNDALAAAKLAPRAPAPGD